MIPRVVALLSDKRALFAVTTVVLSLLPWAVDNWPTQDGPNHLATAHILMRFADRDAPFARYLSLDSDTLRPSTFYYGALSLLGAHLPLALADKLLVSLSIAALPLSSLLFVRSLVPARADAAFLVLPLVTGWPLAMGFVPFVMALSCAYAVLSLGWGAITDSDRSARTWKMGCASVAFLLCALLHPVVGVCAGVALLLLYGPRLRRPSACATAAIITAPAAAFVATAYVTATGVTAPGSSETSWESIPGVLSGLIEYHVAYSAWELVPRGAVILVLLYLTAKTVRTTPLGSESAQSAAARVVMVFMALYVVAPKVLADWAYCSARFLFFATFLMPAVAEIPARHARRVPALGATLALLVVACELPQLSRLSAQVQNVADVGRDIMRGARLIEMDFADRRWGAIDKPQPLAHAWELLLVSRDVVGAQLSAAGKPRTGGERFRMLSFRPGVLDTGTGSLPWSFYEGAYDEARACKTGTREACSLSLAGRKARLDRARDRYEYLLLVSPPDFVRELLGEGLSLQSHSGVAWLYEKAPASTSAEQ